MNNTIKLMSATAGSLTLVLSLSASLNASGKPPAARPDTAKSNAAKPDGLALYRRSASLVTARRARAQKRIRVPLTGTRSAGELAQFIARAMPPGPRKCASGDARQIAAAIYDAFYSPVAQARARPARVELSRLTVRQYRNVLCDLIGGFRHGQTFPAERGLAGAYYKAKSFDNRSLVIQGSDPQIEFNFGTDGPIVGQFDPHQFSIRWTGSVLAPDTGEYDFVVRSEHAVRLWVNDREQPLIDAWVKSGSDSEYHGTIFLIGGRAYPLRLEFSKSTQGVDDTDKKKGKPAPKASITLAWKRPKMAVETIPSRCLLPVSLPEAFVPATPFPPDDRSIGYERGNSVSKEWDDAATSGALETAAYVTAHLRELSGADENDKERPAKLRDFCRRFVERALRRPLSPQDAQFYVERQFAATPDVETAVKRVVLLALLSPQFLYREIGVANAATSAGTAPLLPASVNASGKTSGAAKSPPAVASPATTASGSAPAASAATPSQKAAYDAAARLSFGLWDSLPDDGLLKAASSGELNTPAQIRTQAERLAADPRAWPKLREFLLQWLKVDQVPDLAKNAKLYPDFDDATRNDLRASLELFLENTVGNDKSDFRELLQTDKIYLNGRLAKLYGANLPPNAPFQAVTLDAGERSGILTHPYLMASFAYIDNSSPIHRGVLIARNLLGRTLQPPPAAFAPLAADLHPGLTTRERVALQTKPSPCNSCHNLINPLGFTLEKFDAIGRLRNQEKGKPVDAAGLYQARSGKQISFSGARDLGQFLAGSDEAHSAFVEKLFQYMVKQPIRAYGPQTLPNLTHYFETHEYSIRHLMVEIMTVAALPPGKPKPADSLAAQQSKQASKL